MENYLLRENVGDYLHGSGWENHHKPTKKGETLIKWGTLNTHKDTLTQT